MPKSYRYLSNERPDIAEEWDYEKNKIELGEHINPDTVSFGSHTEAWWKCSLGHSWKTSIQHRTSKNFARGCPFCNNRRVLPGFNDLKTLRPEIAEEWDYEKNIDVDGNKLVPEQFTEHNGYVAWWKCKFGHSWKVRIATRTSDNTGCPKCCKNSTSYPEQLIYLLLQRTGLRVYNREKINNIEFDISLPDNNCYIEYNSIYHTGKHVTDNKKLNYCREHGVKFIVIDENKEYELNKHTEDGYSIYRYKGIVHGNVGELLDIVNSILVELSINYKFESIPDDIRIMAYKYSHNHIKYEDSLAYKYPEVAELLIDELNGGITAKDITPYTSFKVYWMSLSGVKLSKVHDIVGNYVKRQGGN